MLFIYFLVLITHNILQQDKDCQRHLDLEQSAITGGLKKKFCSISPLQWWSILLFF